MSLRTTWGKVAALVKLEQKCNKLIGLLNELTGAVFLTENVSFFCSKACGIKRKRTPLMLVFCGLAF